MDNMVEVPLVTVTRDDEAAAVSLVQQARDAGMMNRAGGFRLPPVDKNYAEDEDVKRRITEQLNPLVTWVRLDRMTLEAEWRAIMRMEWQVHDEGRKYIGRSNSYLPIFARINQTLVSALSRGLFPSDEYMDVLDRSAQPDLDKAKATKAYLQWEFERVGQVRRKIKPFLRSLSAFGNAPLKFWYAKESVDVGRRVRTDTGVVPRFQPTVMHEGLRVSPRNLFNWYVYPYTAESLDEAVCVFEDINVPQSYIDEMVARKKYLNGDAASRAEEPTTHQTNESVRLTSLLGLSTQQASPMQGNQLGRIRTLTECWTYLKLPRSAYMEGENPDDAVPVQVLLAGTVPVVVRRNPFWHQRPPYLFGRLNTQPGLIYGYGNGRMARSLQYMTNDFANQTLDTASLNLNPITIRNPAYFSGPLRPLSPGVVWDTSDVKEAVRFESPDLQVIDAGLNMINWLESQGFDLSGAPPAIQGSSAGGTAKTATGAQILQHNAMQPLQDVVEDIEWDVMTPLMYGTWVNAQQYRDDGVMTMVAGQPVKIDPEMLMIDPEMRYMASSQSVNQMQRAQQLMAYFRDMLLPSIPILAQQGIMVNPLSLNKRVLADGMGFRIPPDLFVQMPMMPGAPSPMNMNANNPTGMDPDAMQAQENMMQSAAAQANGIPDPSAVGMEPGEDGAFQDVRDDANMQAAMMGGSNGKF